MKYDKPKCRLCGSFPMDSSRYTDGLCKTCRARHKPTIETRRGEKLSSEDVD